MQQDQKMLAHLVFLAYLLFYLVYGSILIIYEADNSYRDNRCVIWVSLIFIRTITLFLAVIFTKFYIKEKPTGRIRGR